MTISKTTVSLAVCFSLAMGLSAASQLTFSDSWKDVGSYSSDSQMYGVTTTGSFSTSISLPLNGVDLSEADANSMVTLNIGPAGGTTQIISDTLGDVNYTPGKNFATYPIFGQDAAGDTVIKGSVKVTWTSTAIMVSGNASSDALGEEQLFAMNSSGTPANSPINGFYEVSLTMDASDNGGGIYNYDNQYVPVKGSDKETEYNPPDGSGPYALESGSVSGAGDFTPPKLSITSPASGLKVYDANTVIDLKGTTSDSDLVTNVECIVNGDINDPILIDQDSSLPTNSLAWTAEVDLSMSGQVGTNILTVISQDSSGNQASVSRTYYWIETNTVLVSVNPPGAGKIAGIKNNQVLYVGQGYPVAATATNSNWIFSQWTDGFGDVLSSNAVFDYFDENAAQTNNLNPILIAVFVANPFTNSTLVGNYTGLYFDTNNGPEVFDSGYLTISVTKTGSFSGKLYNADESKTTFPISGQLTESEDGSYASAVLPLIKMSTHKFAQVALQIVTDPYLADLGAGTMSGLVNFFTDTSESFTNGSAAIQGELSHDNTNIMAGLYNIVASPASIDPSLGPGGYSFVSANVSDKKGSAGAVTMTLNLADSSVAPISFSSALAQDGTCPFYAALYGGNGVILGWLQFATDGSGAVNLTTAYWVTGFDYTSRVYTNGFQAQLAVSGQLYLPPKAGTNIVGTTTPTFEIDPNYAGFNLPDEVDIPATFNPGKSTFTVPGKVDKLSVNLSASTGAISGTFADPDNGKPCTYKGVIMNGAGYGYWIAPSKETGPIFLDPPVVESYGGDSGLTEIIYIPPSMPFAPILQPASGVGLSIEQAPVVPPAIPVGGQ